MSSVGIVAFMTRPLPELRTALRGIRETAPPGAELAVVAIDAQEQDATYLLRQYLRGRIDALGFDRAARLGSHCGLDRGYRMVHGDYFARVDDTLAFEPGWLERAIGVLEADQSLGCLSLVPPGDYHRGRGRPRTVHVEPLVVERLDMRCYVTRRELVARHACELMGAEEGDGPDGGPDGGSGGGWRFQQYLQAHGKKLAYLPGVVTALALSEVPSAQDACAHEAELPAHEGASGAMQHLEQSYELGDDVLLTCMACGSTELEVLAARIRFCESHQVAIGFWYELRCPECNEVYYKDDFQFSCPG